MTTTANIAANAAITAANAAITAASVALHATTGTPAGSQRPTDAGKVAADTALADLAPTLAGLRNAWQGKRPDYQQRRDDLLRLREALKRRLDEMAETIAADFGQRSRHESLIADGMTVLNEVDHLRKHLRKWMKPRRVGVGWRFWPARAEIRSEPVGVVGVIAPWNYPVNLALIPLATAIAAGNHVYLKPSEHTPTRRGFIHLRRCLRR